MIDDPYNNFIERAGRARLADEPLPKIAEPDLPRGEDQGYAVQARLAEWFKQHDCGDVSGYKIGATTRTMQLIIGVDGPAYGRILSTGIFPTGAQVFGKHFCKTAVECELAAHLGNDIPPRKTPWVRDEIVHFIRALAPAIEIVENRYGDFRSAGIGTLVADDFFHKASVLGASVDDWKSIDLPAINGTLSLNGVRAETGKGADVLGDPLEAVVWLANTFAKQERTLRANDVVLTGSMTPVHWIDEFPSRVEIEISGIGVCAADLV
jgi:2-keto-4-pentenoate hydratase